MKIDNNKIGLANLYSKQQFNVEKTKSLKSKKDNFTISEEAKDFQTVYKYLNNTPEVRQDKIDTIKNKMEQGNYNIPSIEIAKKIIN